MGEITFFCKGDFSVQKLRSRKELCETRAKKMSDNDDCAELKTILKKKLLSCDRSSAECC